MVYKVLLLIIIFVLIIFLFFKRLISDNEEAFDNGEKIGIPFYKTVKEGANFEGADWKDQACCRMSIIRYF